MKRTGRLPAQSPKRKAQALERRRFVAEFLAKNPACQVGWDRSCSGRAVHVHEALTRARGGVIVPTEGRLQLFVATCWSCHAQIHDHPAEATARGFLAADSAQLGRFPPPAAAARLEATQARIRDVAKRYGL